MLVDFSVIPLGVGTHLSGDIADVVKIIQRAGLQYEVTPSGTCIQGEWDEVMPVVKSCLDSVRERSPHVVAVIKIEDQEGDENPLMHNVVSVTEKVSADA